MATPLQAKPTKHNKDFTAIKQIPMALFYYCHGKL